MKTYCFFSAFYLPHLGGVEQYTHHLAKELIKRGHRVVIVTARHDDLPVKEEQDGLVILRLNCAYLMNARFPLPLPGKAYCSAIQELDACGIDAVIIQTRFFPLSLLGMAFAKRRRLPSICIEHGTSHLTYGGRAINLFVELYEHAVTAIGKLLCRDYYGVSMDAAQWLKHYHIKAKGVLYNSVDVEEIDALLASPAERFKEKYHLTEQHVVVAYTGRLVEEKGILQLIAAVEALEETHPELVLMIAGDGQIMPEVKQHEGARVIVLGRLTFAKVVALLGESDIFCLPTAYPEGFPTSTLEAMACRCYPIVTPRGGARELIEDESYGCVVEDNDVDTLVGAIKAALDDPQQRHEAALRARDRVMDQFSWKRAAQRLIEIE